ncbi:MAG: hypothetical protein R3B96_03165 [Pirellulaceae bacterium]
MRKMTAIVETRTNPQRSLTRRDERRKQMDEPSPASPVQETKVKAMRLAVIGTGLMVVVAMLPTSLRAQGTYGPYNGSAQTYVMSSSPSSDGGTITTTYTAPRSVSVGSTVGPPTSGPAQVTYSPSYGPQVPGTPVYGAGQPTFDPYARGVAQANYQVPANLPPTLPQTPSGQMPAGGVVNNAAINTSGYSGYNNAGINPYVGYPVRTAPVSGAVVPVGYQVANYPQGMSTCDSPAGLPPSLSYQTPGAVGQPYGYGYGTVPVNGNYKPLAPLFSVPNGTYVSQGLLGQPKAYVNGQPVRNIFRYILP